MMQHDNGTTVGGMLGINPSPLQGELSDPNVDIFLEGYTAFYEGLKFTDSAYRFTRKEFAQWKKGWLMAYSKGKK